MWRNMRKNVWCEFLHILHKIEIQSNCIFFYFAQRKWRSKNLHIFAYSQLFSTIEKTYWMKFFVPRDTTNQNKLFVQRQRLFLFKKNKKQNLVEFWKSIYCEIDIEWKKTTTFFLILQRIYLSK